MKKNIFGLSILVIVVICTLNVQNSLSISNELGYSSLEDLITLNSASAETGSASCTGSTCDDANDNHYSYIESNGKGYCCGGASETAGKKSS